MAEPFLTVRDISKAFAGVRALQDVSLSIGRGEIHAMAGENGSGKSTLIKIISGVYEPDSGEIIIAGEQYDRLQPSQSLDLGIQVIYQDFSLFPNLTVAENIALNYKRSQGARMMHWGEAQRIAQEALDKIKVDIDLNLRVEEISVADKQLVAISRAMLQDARLIIMDEPTTALTEREVNSLFDVVNNLRDEHNVSFLFVSHKLTEILQIADSISILRNGKKVFEGDIDEVDQARISYYMTGKAIDVTRYEPQIEREAVEPLLRVKDLQIEGALRDISFELWPHEILGFAGRLGSGRTELALALFGVLPIDGGQIYVNGQPVRLHSIQDAMKHGIGYVPEDRLTEGLFLEQSVSRNIVLGMIDRVLGTANLIDADKMRSQVRRWVGNLSIMTPSIEAPVKTLSGGNQQRVVLAKWLASRPKVLILNGPTVGVDVGSKSELHELMIELAREGIGLIVISDEIPELLHTTNRIFYMDGGRIVEQFNTEEVTENELSRKLRQVQT